MARTYAEKLLDPRWQKKRLEVMERGDFKCQNCEFTSGDKGKTLHVHHCWYERGVEPWEYPDEAYQCLCVDCHTLAEAARLKLSKKIFTLLPCQLDSISASLESLQCTCGPGLDGLLEYVVLNDEQVTKGLLQWKVIVATNQNVWELSHA